MPHYTVDSVSELSPAPWAVISVIQRVDRNLILVVHGPKGLGFPGGKPNEGETVFAAGVRELREETGLIITSEECVEFIDPMPADNGIKTYALNIIATPGGRLEASDEGVPYWTAPWVLVSKHARFPKYNRRLMDILNIRYARYK